MMYPGMICLERDRLLSEATSATDAHQNAVAKVAEVSGIGRSEEFAKRRAEALNLSIVAQAAWKEYRNHLKEHGC